MERSKLLCSCRSGQCRARVAYFAVVLLLASCALACTNGCTSEAPDTAVAGLDPDDSHAQSSACEVLRANGIEAIGGIYLNDAADTPDAAEYLIFVRKSAQARAAKLIAEDATHRGYSVTLHSRGSKETINADVSRKSNESSERAGQPSDEVDVEKAIADYDEVIRSNPGNAEAYWNRGVAYGKQGNLDQALEDLTRAVQLDPSLAEAFNARGVAWGMSGDFAKAIADFDEALRLQPDLAKAYSNRGLAHRRNGDFDKAEADFKRANELDPTNVGVQ